jgi:energy-coupling factor transporter ATP-binding protein EcfA2
MDARDRLGTLEGATVSAPLQLLRQQVLARLQRGERVALYGPRGAGKTTLLARLHQELSRAGIPCGRSPATSHLDDITQALAGAYPEVNAVDVARRTARSRLWIAADRRGGVLLLDHVTAVNNAMVGFMRRLVGGIAGVLFVFDVDTPRERNLIRPGRLGGMPLAMPSTSTATLRMLWRRECMRSGVLVSDLDVERRVVRAAAGRPGWIVQCAELVTERHYWREHSLALVNLLCADAEIALRFGVQQLADLDRSSRLRSQAVRIHAAALSPGSIGRG